MKAKDLRALAQRKRRAAEVAYRVDPSLALAADREAMRQQAQDIETEAAALWARADALDVQF